jgi:threonine synthase
VVRAFESGADSAEPFENASTVASGLRVPSAIGDFLMLEVLSQSGGTAISVSDEALLEAVSEMAAGQGMFVCPEAGAVWAAAKQLRESGWLGADERIVLFNTGSGLKYNHLFPPGDLPRLDHTDPDCLDALDS